MNKKIYNIKIEKFITHIPKTNNKIAPNKYIKINNQLIYNSNLNRFQRNIVVNNLHDYLINYINKELPKLTNPPYQISLDIYAPINYGTVSRRKRKDIPYISWKYPEKNYKPNWDIDNLGDIWLKVFKDALQLSEVLENDNVTFVKINGPTIFHKIENFDNRKFIFKIKEL